MLVRRIVEEGKVSGAQLARDSSLSAQSLHMWMSGRRTPQPESLRQLANGLDFRAGLLAKLAAELRAEAEGGDDAEA